jgi:RNA polymerase sigma-70 factor (ECF subfamily)
MIQPPAPLSASRFAEVLECTQQLVYRFMRQMLGSDEDARDGVQEVFVDAWRAAQRLAPPFTHDGSLEDMRRWLLHTAYQRTVSILRRRRVLAWESLDVAMVAMEEEALLPGSTAPFEDLIVQGDEWREILGNLEPQEAACLILKVLQGYSCVQLAEIFGISPEAARKRLSRATQRLRVAYFARQAPLSPRAGKECRDA